MQTNLDKFREIKYVYVYKMHLHCFAQEYLVTLRFGTIQNKYHLIKYTVKEQQCSTSMMVMQEEWGSVQK